MLQRVLLALATAATLTVVGTVTASDQGHAAAEQVSEASYRYFLGDNEGVEGILYTHAGDNRGFGPEHDLARDNIADQLESYGLIVTLEPFIYWGSTYYNVVGTKIGTTYPEREYIVGAHYDSVDNPGADDNASGVALVLEAARILTQYDSDYTIRFIGFDREEQGLVGSDAYVDAHILNDIRGMISADMVAYNSGANLADIYGRSASNPIKNALADAVTEYGDGLSYAIQGQADYSDHAPFEWAGFQACLLIESGGNPYYHTQNDNVDMVGYIDYAFAVRMSRSIVGFLVDHAGVQVDVDALEFTYPDGRPELVCPAGGTRTRVEVAGVGEAVPQPGTGLLYYDVGDGWQTVAMDVVSENVYDAVFPAAPCRTEVLYYVSAETTGGETFSDPRNAPAAHYTTTAAYSQTVVFEDMFDASPGWTTEGQWAFGQPTGGGGEYGGPDPTSGYTGDYVYGYNLNGDYANNLPQRHLTSTAIDCTGQHDVHLKFWRWLGVEQPAFDHAYVRVSNNGTNWTTVWENTTEIADYDWVEMDLDISEVADDQPTVYLRWTMGPTDGGWRYCGWNVDDVSLTALQCVSDCLGDIDNDGDIDLSDLAILLANYGMTSGAEYANGDLDADGDVDLTDLAELLAVYGTPCG